MSWRVIPAVDVETWQAAVAGLLDDDPYFSASYHLAYAYDGGQSWLYLYDDGCDRLAYPFRQHTVATVAGIVVDGDYCDIETVYGYSGPLATTGDPVFLARAWAGFAELAADRHVVSEFCRFHPLLGNSRLAAAGMMVIEDRATVAVPLLDGPEAIWAGYEPTQRNRVRKSMQAGLVCRQLPYAEGIETFRPIYEETMTAVGAGAFYHFPSGYYDALGLMAPQPMVFAVFLGNLPVAAAVFLAGPDTVHYHLGGSRHEHRALGPNNLLFHAVAEWAARQGRKYLFLGGGRSSRDDDELLRFKRRFSRRTLPFHLGKRIWDQAAYDRLSDIWYQRSGRLPSHVLQHYRLPIGEQ